MTQSGKAVRHIHRRKVHKEFAPYPHPIKWKKVLDDVVLVIAFIFPLSALPQVIKIFSEKSVEGVSLLTWIFWSILTIPLFVYAFVHKEKPMVIMYFLWMFVYIAVITGIFMYN